MDPKKQTFLSIIAIIIIMALSYIIFPGGQRPQNSFNNDSSTQEHDRQNTVAITDPILSELSFETERIEEVKEDAFYEISAEYPRIIGLNDATAQNQINLKIQEFILEKIKNFKTSAEEIGRPKGLGNEYLLEINSTFNMEYLVTMLKESLISIKFSVSEYYTGAAHPNSYIATFNYDPQKQEEIALKHLFRPNINYLEILSNKAEKALVERFKGEIEGIEKWIGQGTAPKAENFQNFTFSQNYLSIYFNPYQVGPYASGLQYVEIPYTELFEYLDPASLSLR